VALLLLLVAFVEADEHLAVLHERVLLPRGVLDRLVVRDPLPFEVEEAPRQAALRASKVSNMTRPTIREYVTLLERVFLLEELPPWHSNRISRLVKTPKLHMGDTGITCVLLGLEGAALRKDRTTFGQVLESFVFQELRREASWHEDEIRFHYFRDIVVERGGRELAGVEVKAAATVTAADFRGLRRLGDAAGKRFAAGVVLYDGEMSATFGDRLFAVPIRALWETT
jgi:predicted AAA+ superfamily ATPase